MFVTELFEGNQAQIKVIYPGRFQPFHKGHAAVYKHLVQQYGADNVFIVTSDKTDNDKSPFSFEEKKRMMVLTGIDASKVVQSTQPYRATEIVSKFDPATTILLFAVSEKDMAEDPRFQFAPKKDGSPSYFQAFTDISQCNPLNKHAYMITVPTFEFQVLGASANSASQIRAQFASSDEATQQKIVADLFGKFDHGVYTIMRSKLAKVAPAPVTEVSAHKKEVERKRKEYENQQATTREKNGETFNYGNAKVTKPPVTEDSMQQAMIDMQNPDPKIQQLAKAVVKMKKELAQIAKPATLESKQKLKEFARSDSNGGGGNGPGEWIEFTNKLTTVMQSTGGWKAEQGSDGSELMFVITSEMREMNEDEWWIAVSVSAESSRQGKFHYMFGTTEDGEASGQDMQGYLPMNNAGMNELVSNALEMYGLDDVEESVNEAAKWRQGYSASGHPAGYKHKDGQVGPVGGTFTHEPSGYDGETSKVPVQKHRDQEDQLKGRELTKLSTTGKPLQPRNAQRNLKAAIIQSKGKHGPVGKLPESEVTESANDADYFDNWYKWDQAVRRSGGTTEHSGGGRYSAIGMDGEGFGVWDENTGEGFIDFSGDSPYLGNNDSLGESKSALGGIPWGRVDEGKFTINAKTGAKLHPKTGAEIPGSIKAPKEPKVRAPASPRRDSNGLTKDDYGTVWRKIEEVVGNIFPDGDPIDWLAPWLKKSGIRDHHIGEVLDKACKMNGYKNMYKYYDSFKTDDYGYKPKITVGAYHPPRKSESPGFGSKHIGGGKATSKGKVTGLGANTTPGTKPVVNSSKENSDEKINELSVGTLGKYVTSANKSRTDATKKSGGVWDPKVVNKMDNRAAHTIKAVNKIHQQKVPESATGKIITQMHAHARNGEVKGVTECIKQLKPYAAKLNESTKESIEKALRVVKRNAK